MASDYDDGDRRDDRYDDDSSGSRDDRVVAIAKQKIKTPAVLMLVAGVLGGLFALMNVPGMLTVDATFQKAEDQWDQDPNIKDEQRKEMKRVLADVKGPVKIGMPVWIGLSVIGSIVSIAGAVRIMNLKSRGLGVLGAIATMLPLGCCCLSLPVGIWVLLVLGKPEVKAGFAAVAKGAGEY